MAVLCINLSGSNAVIRDINRAKDELENILKDLNKAQNNISNSIYISGLSSYRSSIESEKASVQRDVQKLSDFSKAYKSFLENAERIDKQYAKIISNDGYDYRKETGLIKEEWKKAGKLIIGTLIIAGTVAAAVFVSGPILIGAAVGACVSATIGAGAGYLTGGAEGAIDGFFYGSISGAITGAIGGLVAGPPPALGAAPKEVLKYMAKQSIADGVGEGLAGGTVGYMKGGTEGAIAGGASGLVTGAVTGLISGGISYKAQGLPQKIINKFKEGKVNADINIDTKGVSKADNLWIKSTCNNDELYNYLLKNVNEDVANKFLKDGKWPDGIQIPKNSSVVNPNGSINWSKAAEGGYTLSADGTAIKQQFNPQVGEVIDRYGNSNGRYTSPVIDGKPYSYTERSLPYVEDLSNYHQYEVVGDLNKLEEYVNNCKDIKVKNDIEDIINLYFSGDYNKVIAYKGEIAGINGWGIGGGIQYELPITVDLLEKLGILKEIK